MLKIINIIAIIVISAAVKAQVLAVSDAINGEPVEMVAIYSDKPRILVHTNSQGEADLKGFEKASKIELRSLGYKSRILTWQELQQLNFRIAMERAFVVTDEAVVSATKWKQSAGDLPQKVSLISGKDIELYSPQTAADMLANSGKVFVQKSQQGGGSPIIRGFATNRLLYSVDGVRMNTAIFRSGNIQNVISLDPFAMESAEVLFGAGTVSYGSDAIGGVMSFTTLRPQLSANNKPVVNGKAVARYSSANREQSFHFDVNTGWHRMALLSSFSSNDFGDLTMGSYGPAEYLRHFYVMRQDSSDIIVANEDPRVQRPSGYSQINFMQKLKVMPNLQWSVDYAFHYSETSPYSRYDRHIRFRDGLPRYGEWSYGPQKWSMNHLSVDHKARRGIYDEATLNLAQQLFAESRISRDLQSNLRETRKEQVDALSANLDFVKNTGSRNTLYYGAEYVINRVESNGEDEDIFTVTKAQGPSRYPQATWTSMAAYVSDQYRISEKLRAVGGLRYNEYSIKADFDTTFYPFPFTEANLENHDFTGSLGLNFKPTDTWVLSMNMARAFRAPNVDDLGKVFDSEAGAVTVPNPDLRAEVATSVDVGLVKVFGESFKVDVSAYYTLLDNAMVRRDFKLNGEDSIVYAGEISQVQAIQNAAKAEVYGIQAGIELKLKSGVGVASDFNWQQGEEELDNGNISNSRHAAPWFGISRISYSLPKMQLEVNVQYSGEVSHADLAEEERGKPEIYASDKDGNPYSPSWYSLNFRATKQISQDLSLSAGLENITDQRYRPYSSGIAAAGRNVVLSVKAIF
jgi:hemoglobin/transferrin/lactoferrin receptor protein